MADKSPISHLQEICVRKRIPMPRYHEPEWMGPPNERLFAVSVDVAGEAVIGRGLTIKAAKTEAAQKALHQIWNVPLKPESEFPSKSDAENSETLTRPEKSLKLRCLQLEQENSSLHQRVQRLEEQLTALTVATLMSNH